MGNQHMKVNTYLGQPCARCKNTLVRSRSRAAERAAGEVAYKSRGLCHNCYRIVIDRGPRTPSEQDVFACTDCDRLIQKRETLLLKGFKRARLTNPPLCGMCYQRRVKSGTLRTANQVVSTDVSR